MHSNLSGIVVGVAALAGLFTVDGWESGKAHTLWIGIALFGLLFVMFAAGYYINRATPEETG